MRGGNKFGGRSGGPYGGGKMINKLNYKIRNPPKFV
jgi:hypothetical protein